MNGELYLQLINNDNNKNSNNNINNSNNNNISNNNKNKDNINLEDKKILKEAIFRIKNLEILYGQSKCCQFI